MRDTNSTLENHSWDTVGTIKNRWERKIIGWDDKEHYRNDRENN